MHVEEGVTKSSIEKRPMSRFPSREIDANSNMDRTVLDIGLERS